jgi:hypothetical protein
MTAARSVRSPRRAGEPAARPASARPAPETWEREANRVAFALATSTAAGPAPPPAAPAGGAIPVPRSVRDPAERLLGHDFAGVRVHPEARRRAGGAGAETSGDDIHVAPGHLRPELPLGRALLAHELAHVAQQRAPGRASIADPGGPGITPAPRGMRQRTVACTPESSNDSPSPSPSPPPTPAPQPAPTPSPPDPKAEVEKVKSLRLEEDLKPGLTADEAVVEKKYKARKDAIDKALAAAGSTSSYGQKLARDLAKSRDDVVKTRDEAANPALRDDILKAIAEVAATKKNLADEETAFRRFDDVFAGKDVAAALSGSGFTASDLKALVSQESGDLLKKHEADASGNIQGIAQLGKSAAEAVGADPADRTDPAKAIVIAAKYLAHNAGLLKKSLSPLPTGEDFKKFVIASYNAGQLTIETAQKKAIAQSRAGATWSDIVDPAKGKGNDTAPLYKAWAEMKASVQGLGKIDVAQKYGETKGYVERIYRRLGK